MSEGNKNVSKENQKNKKKNSVEDNQKDNHNTIHSEESDYTFIREKIKERPINKRKLLRKLLFTAGMAIVFGLIACLTIMFIEPILGRVVNADNDEGLKQIVLPETSGNEAENYDVVISDTPFEETPIEDMNFRDEESGNENASNEVIQATASSYELNLEEYQKIYKQLFSLSKEVEKSIVTITAVSEDMDILNESYLSTNKTAGMIIYSDDEYIYIAAECSSIDSDADIMVTFCDGTVYNAELKKMDSRTNLSIYMVDANTLSQATKDSYVVATLGSSIGNTLVGSAVVAVGNPMGLNSSVCYGMVTSNDSKVSLPDSSYQLVTTDIYGSRNGYGFLVNVRGQFVGIITPDYHANDVQNIIYAYGMSGVRNLLEDLSNGKENAYIGLRISDVSEEAAIAYNMPYGAYITSVEKDSPAMEVGITAGDIVTSINGVTVANINEYMTCLDGLKPGDEVELIFDRFSAGEYKETSVEIVLGEW